MGTNFPKCAKSEKLALSSSSSNDFDERSSPKTTLASRPAVNLVHNVSVKVRNNLKTNEEHTPEVWCRGVCNICPDNWSEEEETRQWIQCCNCGGWWHLEHANLRNLNESYLKMLRWRCRSIGISCPGAPFESTFSLGSLDSKNNIR